jgi:hypothetical protein
MASAAPFVIPGEVIGYLLKSHVNANRLVPGKNRCCVKIKGLRALILTNYNTANGDVNMKEKHGIALPFGLVPGFIVGMARNDWAWRRHPDRLQRP